jgi:hypothetical protein
MADAVGRLPLALRSGWETGELPIMLEAGVVTSSSRRRVEDSGMAKLPGHLPRCIGRSDNTRNMAEETVAAATSAQQRPHKDSLGFSIRST